MGKTLQLLARLFYCSSATSAETERVFSLSKFVDTALRQSLSDTKLEFQIVVSCFIRWIFQTKQEHAFFEDLNLLIRNPSEIDRTIHYIC